MKFNANFAYKELKREGEKKKGKGGKEKGEGGKYIKYYFLFKRSLKIVSLTTVL